LKHLATLVKERIVIGSNISKIIGRPALIDHIGEYGAAKIFDIAFGRFCFEKAIGGDDSEKQ
jgi:hypothetical protein